VPQAVRDWFNQMYVDSQDWVVSPNVIGMGLFADGGKMSTKPYVSSAQYIKKMSNYCNRCEFDPNERIGEKACPFNALYWTFLSTHENLLQKNHRMSMMIASLKKWTERDKSDCQKQAQNLLKRLEKHQI
jgi:deoxyribodipyrimidine photolyase-related protein